MENEVVMDSYLDCLPCVIRQASDAVRQAGLKRDLQTAIMKRIMATLAEMELKNGSSEMIQKAFQIIREAGHIHDPLENAKSYSMDIALRAYPELKLTLNDSKDRFATAVRIAMAGNIIDHERRDGEQDNLSIFHSVEAALTRPLAMDHIDFLKEEVQEAKNILFLADNAGETVFDRILLEEMPLERILYAVRSQPVSNDATLRDAVFAGLTEIVKVIEDGSDYPCSMPDRCSPEFLSVFDEADLIIAKGQANLRALREIDKNIFFLARIRCKGTAADFNLSVGDFIVKGLKYERS